MKLRKKTRTKMRNDDPGQKISMKGTSGKPEHRWEKIYRIYDLSTTLDQLMIPTVVLSFVGTVRFHRVP